MAKKAAKKATKKVAKKATKKVAKKATKKATKKKQFFQLKSPRKRAFFLPDCVSFRYFFFLFFPNPSLKSIPRGGITETILLKLISIGMRPLKFSWGARTISPRRRKVANEKSVRQLSQLLGKIFIKSAPRREPRNIPVVLSREMQVIMLVLSRSSIF